MLHLVHRMRRACPWFHLTGFESGLSVGGSSPHLKSCDRKGANTELATPLVRRLSFSLPFIHAVACGGECHGLPAALS